MTYSLFGVGAGLLNPAVTYGVMTSVPDGQAGVASGMNSSSRQLGQCLGVAVTGTVLDGSLHGPMQTGFPRRRPRRLAGHGRLRADRARGRRSWQPAPRPCTLEGKAPSGWEAR